MTDYRGLIREPGIADAARALAHVEFQLRTVGLLVAATDEAAFPETPGSLEKWSDYLKASSSCLNCEPCRIEALSVATSPDCVVAGTLSVRGARNAVFHGAPVPPELDKLELQALLEKNNRSIEAIVLHHPDLVRSPYIVSFAGKLHIFNSFDGATAKYWPAEGAAQDVRDQIVIDQLKPIANRTGRRAFELFASDIERDLRSFAEHGDVRVYIDDVDADGIELVAQWSHRTSSGSTDRIDRLHLGSGSARFWRDGGKTKNYTELLKEAANWPVLRSRLAEDLRRIQSEQLQLHESVFGTPFGGLPDLTQTVRASGIGARNDGNLTFDDYCDHLRANAYRYNAATQIVTLMGEAGAGKTHSLLRFALQSLSAPDEGESPLVLYVSSSGKTANSLETLINDRVAETRLIDRYGVLALCRAGLLILVVDGFDELLGFRSYDEPLRAIQPIIDQLRGSGTLVISARSSYAETRIVRDSIRRDSSQWTPRLVTVELLPLHRDAVASVFTKLSCVEQFDQLEEREQRFITTPFFCASFATWSTDVERQSFLRYIFDSYLKREFKKLELTPEGNPLTITQLSLTLGEVAEMSARSGGSDVSEDDLFVAAELVVGASLSDQSKRRLTTLCGISAEWSEHERSFTFAHPVVFEYFFADQLQRLNDDRVVDVATIVSLPALTARLYCEQSEVEVIRKVIARIGENVARRIEAGQETEQGRRSLGSLFAESLALRPVANATLRNAIVDVLTVPAGVSVVVSNSIVDRAVVNSGGSLRLEKTQVGHVDLANSGLSALLCDEESTIEELMLRSELLTSARAIGQALGMGTEVVGDEEDDDNFFRQAIGGISYIIVVDAETRMPAEEDRRSDWVRARGDRAWVAFLRRAESRGWVTFTPLSSSGKSKERVRFAFPQETETSA